jgi:hypothetical protein
MHEPYAGLKITECRVGLVGIVGIQSEQLPSPLCAEQTLPHSEFDITTRQEP